MEFPNGAGGYQFGDGNLNELTLGYASAPLSVAATATLTAAQVTAGILLVGSGATAAQTYTLPAASLIEAVVTSAKAGSTFDLVVINLGTSSGTGALAMGTGTGFTRCTCRVKLPTAASRPEGRSHRFRAQVLWERPIGRDRFAAHPGQPHWR
jgi:hypothetical protein